MYIVARCTCIGYAGDGVGWWVRRHGVGLLFVYFICGLTIFVFPCLSFFASLGATFVVLMSGRELMSKEFSFAGFRFAVVSVSDIVPMRPAITVGI